MIDESKVVCVLLNRSSDVVGVFSSLQSMQAHVNAVRKNGVMTDLWGVEEMIDRCSDLGALWKFEGGDVPVTVLKEQRRWR